MNGLNSKYDEFIDGLMTSNAKENKDALNSELLNKIPLTDSYTNSISIAVGKQRSGKTRKIIKEIIKISKMHHETHMLLYVNKNGTESDKTFESFKNLIKCPIVYCSQSECEAKLAELVKYKQLYNTVMSEETDEFQDPLEIETMFDVLQVEDYSRAYLHTLVLLDDIANSPLLKKPTTYLNSLMTQCAHINMSFFLAVQYWIGLPTAIKSQTSMIYLFGGFNKQQVRYMFTQIALEDPVDVVWEKYSKLKNRDFMTIDAIAGDYWITESNYKETKPKVDKKIKQKADNQMKGIEEEEEHEDLIQSSNTASDVVAANPIAQQWMNPPPKQETGFRMTPRPATRTEAVDALPIFESKPVYKRKHQPRAIFDDEEPEEASISIFSNKEPVRDTRKDYSPIRPLENFEPNWEEIWNRNAEGKRYRNGWV